MPTPIQWKISLPREVAASVEEELFDPIMGRATYGARSRLVTHLLDEWLSGRRSARGEGDLRILNLVPTEEFTNGNN